MNLEESLRSLAPRKSTLDRDRLMFVAGQASLNRSSNRTRPLVVLWVCSVVSMALGVGMGLWWKSPSPGIVAIEDRQSPSPDRDPRSLELPSVAHGGSQSDGFPVDAEPESVIDSDARSQLSDHSRNYFALRDAVAGQGLEAWPLAPASGNQIGNVHPTLRLLSRDLDGLSL